jgi:3-oxoacyl-[acyl-carrier protein] reductase
MLSGFKEDLFKDKTVLVTGAGRGIGLEIAKAFFACGANVIAHGGREGTNPDLEKVAAKVISADFLDETSLEEFIQTVKNETPELSCLVNNAGTMFGRYPADKIAREEYDRIVMLNQTSVVMITRAMIPLLEAGRPSSIVNTVSISAKTGGSPGSSIYSASKAFVATYTKALARELASLEIRANAISPGTIMTDFHERYSSPEKLESTRSSIPLKRLGTAKDCAPACLFLASDLLSGYITGQVLEINGGQLIA